MDQKFSEFSELREFDKSLNHLLPVSGAVVASWFLTQEVAGLNNIFNIYNVFVTEFSENV